jgi:hypothetical protein
MVLRRPNAGELPPWLARAAALVAGRRHRAPHPSALAEAPRT